MRQVRPMGSISFRAHLMAVDRVQSRLRRVTTALGATGVPYAVIGGNAVAAWVGSVDPGAPRATRDVDLLVRRSDADRITEVMAALGYRRMDPLQPDHFIDPDEPSRRSGVHLVWSGERVRPSYTVPSPTVEEAVRDPEGFLVLDLPALVRMKLTSFRDIDRVHVRDMLEVGLISTQSRDELPAELRARLEQVEHAREDHAG